MIMYRKYFFKNEGILSRKFIVGGLAAVFSSGIFGSYAGAMQKMENINNSVLVNNKLVSNEVDYDLKYENIALDFAKKLLKKCDISEKSDIKKVLEEFFLKLSIMVLLL